MSFFNRINPHLIIGLITLLFITGAFQQEAAGQERSRIRLSFVKKSSGDKLITATLYAGRGKSMVYLENELITLTASSADTTVALAELTTSTEGTAQLMIENGYRFPLDEEGFTLIEASFEGNDEYSSASSDIEVKDLEFDLDFSIEDSVKTVSVRAYERDSIGNEVPVDGLFMYVGVQRLYSILPVGEIMSSEEGVYSIEFPDDIPGDSTGTFTVVARIDDNEYYGSVERKEDIAWGTPVSFELEAPQRKLWTDEAPLWMIASVFIVLAGAWFHFFLSIYKLSRIKKVAGDSPV
ncbi:MAG: hypothetical protein KFF73_16285 [Cyclobacteriaceae bacterium]|nr:hypothetical protein [Cyclobacteriaceae bacterium]